MAGDCSFDIVSQFDEQELHNAIDQTRREVQTRYDLKDTKTEITLKIFKPGKEENAAAGRVRQVIQLQQGISQEQAKEISKYLRDSFPKVRPQIQGEAIRVTAKSRDELQAVIALLRQKDYPLALQFINYRG